MIFMIKEVLYYFEGLDESICKLNDFLIDENFEFKKFTLAEFFDKFKELILIKENDDYGYDYVIPSLDITLAQAVGLDDLKYFKQSANFK